MFEVNEFKKYHFYTSSIPEQYAVFGSAVFCCENQDWRAIQPRSFVPKTTNSNHGLTACSNRLIEFGKPNSPNQVWVGDITYLPLSNGEWAYLASWMDLFSRRIVGWHVDKSMKEGLIIKAFDQATKQRQPKLGLIVHSDRGGQYFGQRFRQRLANWQCRQSMAEADNPYQNAHAESFWVGPPMRSIER